MGIPPPRNIHLKFSAVHLQIANFWYMYDVLCNMKITLGHPGVEDYKAAVESWNDYGELSRNMNLPSRAP